MAIKNCNDLPGDLACAQVALQAKLGRQAELAVDRAANLTGDTDRSAPEAAWRRTVLFAEFCAVIPIRHPHRFNRLSAGLNQVALGAVDAAKALGDMRPSNLPASAGKPVAKRLRQRRYLIEMGDALAIESIRKLPSPIGAFAQICKNLRQCSRIEPEEPARRSIGGRDGTA